ncbi:2-hydroxy-3-oxopropionate reductase [Sphaerisporangium sp. TRM90804]|uniref:2-hydroxy-3-oxopropionate reductase n=1 Tax=Sphaerisporangium sp. TRM90804 TaxID=3031113 RepID=UPI002448B035|nr:2-hydroxy-3-oxopropionate reductase [Sphaerisporangium sp. TRM90804]MDH2428167.1 2-hydroxy-3-oxopropionate reductase [Sphaerisporangium sp. TRM90804]
MTDVTFIGLGIMGAPMAANLIRAGYRVTAYDVDTARVERVVELGGAAAASVPGAVAGAEVVITMLPDSPQVEEVAFGDDGLLNHGAAGMFHLDMSTIKPETACRVAQAATIKGIRPLDAPVSGGERGAADGTLSIMVGGHPDDFEAIRPLLAVLGTTVRHVGPSGSGQIVKAANQLVVGGIYGLVAEAIVLLEASGVDPEGGLDVLAGGLAGSRVLELRRHSMIKREFVPGFRVDLHHKDMGIAVAAARRAGVSLPLTGMVAELMAAAKAQGHGSLDHSALLKVIERING